MGSRDALGKISDSGQDFFFAFVMESETVSQCMGKILPGQDPAHGSGDALRCRPLVGVLSLCGAMHLCVCVLFSWCSFGENMVRKERKNPQALLDKWICVLWGQWHSVALTHCFSSTSRA